MLKRPLTALAALVLVLGVSACGSEDDGDDTASDDSSPTESSESAVPEGSGSCEYSTDLAPPAAKEVDVPPADPAYSGSVDATISTSAGDLSATLDADRAPCTVNSFGSLAEQGYFDQTTCHRLTTEESGILVLQCGDPSASGSGGPGYSFPDELQGDETYGPGTLAMANSGPDTNGSQFFVVYGDTPLPPAYTVFGELDTDAVGAIEKVASEGSNEANGPGDGAPSTPVDIESVTVG